MALGASLVCSVASTRWPVSEAWAAIAAVSGSRISPTKMTSGSWRRIARSADAKVTPCLVSTWICVTPGSSNSIGSSTVMMLMSGPWISCSAAYRVVVLPEPVGPVTTTMPSRCVKRRLKRSSSGASRPTCESVTARCVSRMRMTHFSAPRAGIVEMRRSKVRPCTMTRARPSCGRSRSAMSSFAMTLIREMTRLSAGSGIWPEFTRTPSMR